MTALRDEEVTLCVPLHASLRRDAVPRTDPETGEVRVRLALYRVDELQGDVELVMSRDEWATLMAAQHASGGGRPEGAR